jgi:hypothetical protein
MYTSVRAEWQLVVVESGRTASIENTRRLVDRELPEFQGRRNEHRSELGGEQRKEGSKKQAGNRGPAHRMLK